MGTRETVYKYKSYCMYAGAQLYVIPPSDKQSSGE